MWVRSTVFQWASTHQLGYTISDLMAEKKMGRTGRAAADPSYAQLHGAARDLSFIQPAASAAEQDRDRGCFGSHSWRQELSEGAIHWHRDQPAHGGCQPRLHVTITRHNQVSAQTSTSVPLCLYPKTPQEAPSSFITGCSAICNTQLGSANKYQ